MRVDGVSAANDIERDHDSRQPFSTAKVIASLASVDKEYQSKFSPHPQLSQQLADLRLDGIDGTW